MPRYDFECSSCKHGFEFESSVEEYTARLKAKDIVCPNCDSKEVVRIFSAPGVVTGKAPASSGGCCCPGGKCD